MALIVFFVIVILAVLNLVLTFLQVWNNFLNPVDKLLREIEQALEKRRQERMGDESNQTIQIQLDRIEELLEKIGPIAGEFFPPVYFNQGLILSLLLALMALIVYVEFVR